VESAITARSELSAPPAADATAETYVTVPIAAMQVSNDPTSVLVTYALGSCVGITLHDQTLSVGGLLHVMLPSSDVHAEAAARRPAMYVDTGLASMLGKLVALGCEQQNLVVKIAGGGQLLSASQQLALGPRNVEAVRAACAAHGLTVAAEDVGGTRSRNLQLHVGTGRVAVTSRGKEKAL
jgi:chemotaxis protein CheD